MKLRIAIWAGAGAAIVVFWTMYISATAPAARSAMWSLAYLTCPIALARHYELSFYLVLAANVATYALVGLVVEATRAYLQQTRAALSHSK